MNFKLSTIFGKRRVRHPPYRLVGGRRVPLGRLDIAMVVLTTILGAALRAAVRLIPTPRGRAMHVAPGLVQSPSGRYHRRRRAG